VGPKDEENNDQGKRYHAKEQLGANGRSEWRFEERDIFMALTNMLLVRILIAKVTNMDRLINIVRSIPVQQGVAGWNCVSWVCEALVALEADGKALGTSVVEWTKVRDAAMNFCQRKKDEHRFDGESNFDTSKAPTFDLIENRETVR